MTLEEMAFFSQEGMLGEHLLPPDAPLGHLVRTDVPAGLEKLVRAGSKLPLSAAEKDRLPENVPIRVYLENNFWGIASREGKLLVWRAQIAPDEVIA